MSCSDLPRPRTPDPMEAPPLRWGILGTGWIAERFVASLRAGTRQQVRAVGSRSQATARTAADRWRVETAYGSYAALVADADVDVVYVATPHNLHHEHARLAIDAGKHVLVEKPLGLTAAEARDLAALATSRGLFCSEAMWSLFLPKYDVVRQLLEDGELGRVHTVLADIGESFAESHRIMRADLAGGPLFDLGTYAVMLATWALGPADDVVARGVTMADAVGHGEVTAQLAAVLRHGSRGLSSLHTTILSDTPTTATIAGDEAVLVLDQPFYQPGAITLRRRDGSVLWRDEPAVGHAALHFQAADAASRISAGSTTSSHRPMADTITTLAAMDAVRRGAGITDADRS